MTMVERRSGHPGPDKGQTGPDRRSSARSGSTDDRSARCPEAADPARRSPRRPRRARRRPARARSRRRSRPRWAGCRGCGAARRCTARRPTAAPGPRRCRPGATSARCCRVQRTAVATVVRPRSPERHAASAARPVLSSMRRATRTSCPGPPSLACCGAPGPARAREPRQRPGRAARPGPVRRRAPAARAAVPDAALHGVPRHRRGPRPRSSGWRSRCTAAGTP